ncbi:type II toxin-antitoxin system death-on-curing family toxin [Thiohalophilus sp.]|uniref:type II toxin-antitoxin system death-on-curing family toxin n=1 Tax=Thiohalophilus sp. TaxID=3028392 RepID=UPI002ACD46AD|nr:type II toxin-antitoxin system death-on-curing family toxin [Thiohalophilus sp.]MDZ7663035.1 type II toxin-antitoxin system death-on-curing family toxin [Thiohalophilus sp.]
MPNSPVQFLTLDEVLEIHNRLIHHFGGLEGIRDMGLLESALFRPRTGYYQDLIEMAAALSESLLMNHPFVDGNKRIAFFATDIFLRLNGWKFQVKPDQAYSYIIGRLENHQADFENLRQWIQKSIVRLGNANN